MKKIVAIGGGENGRLLDNGEFAPYQTEFMDKEIVKLTNKVHPNFLFLGHAMSDSLKIQESYFQTMKKIYGEKFGCSCRDLKTNELSDIIKVKEKLDWADIIYEGGGNTFELIKIWKKTGFDKLLHYAWKNGKVICGVSAGAVCWFKSCNSDSSKPLEFKSVDCLNWINVHIIPHCDETGRYESAKYQLRENDLVGIMLSNCSAIEILDNQYRFIFSNKKSYVIKAYWDNGKFIEKKITFESEYEDLNELLKKD